MGHSDHAPLLGAANGIATLGAGGKVPAGQLPASSKYSSVEPVTTTRDLTTADYGKLLVMSGVGTELHIRKATNYGEGFWFAVVSNDAVNAPTVRHNDAGGGNFYTATGNSDTIDPGVVGNKIGAYVECSCFRSSGAGPYVQDFCLNAIDQWDQT